jgi:hypothetical protein
MLGIIIKEVIVCGVFAPFENSSMNLINTCLI